MRRTDIKLLLLFALVTGLMAVVYSCGNPADSKDTTSPVVSITNPVNNSVVPNTVDVRAEASDNEGVARVEFYIDGQLYFTDEVAPWSCYWTIEGGESGAHTLYAKAFDAAGNSDRSDDVTVTCENTPPAAVDDLAATDPDINGDLTLTWTAPGDDGTTGTAAVYDVRCYWSEITAANWVSASRLEGEPTPQVAGSTESLDVVGLFLSSTYYFAMRTQDAAGNWSDISNNVVVTTQSLFGSPVSISVQDMARSMEIADLDNDQDLDLIVGHRLDADNVSILFNNGDGSFTAPTIYHARTQVSSVAATDVDFDGDLDIAATSNSLNLQLPTGRVSRVSILLNDGFGLFDLQVLDTYDTSFLYCTSINWVYLRCDIWGTVPRDTHSSLYWSVPDNLKPIVDSTLVDTTIVGFYADSNAVDSWLDDFNNDGIQDLAVVNTNLSTSKISVLICNGDGTYANPRNYRIGKTATYSICAGDFNNDGWVDIANTDGGSGQVTVFRNMGAGVFADTGTYRIHYLVGSSPRSLFPSDVNADGYVDLVVANSVSDNIAILFAGAGGFSSASFRPAGSGPWAICADDLNGDDAPELIVGNFYDDNISVMMNQGLFLFHSYNTREFAAGDGPTRVHSADLDGDGDKDVAVLDQNTNTISIIFNRLIP